MYLEKRMIHFITFADGIFPKYIQSAMRLCEMAKDMDVFASIRLYTFEDLKHYPEFINRHASFIQTNPRGFGYWIWKPFLIWKTLQSIPEGDSVLYLDACCSLNKEGIQRFHEYMEIQSKDMYGNLFFDSGHSIKEWTKMDTIYDLGAKDMMDDSFIVSGVLFTSNNPFNRSLFQMLYEECSNYHHIDDSPSILPNDPIFRENRHDQSILSILIKKNCPSSIYKLPRELFFYHREEENRRFPIWIQSNGY